MKGRRRRLLRGNSRLRLVLTLGLAVVLPALALIYVNFHYLKSVKLGKKVETLIHGDFQYVLAVCERKIDQKAYAMTEEVRNLFPSPETDTGPEQEGELDAILAERPWLAHAFLYDAEKGFVFRSQPRQMGDERFREEQKRLAEIYGGWLKVEGKMLRDGRLDYCNAGHPPASLLRAGGQAEKLSAGGPLLGAVPAAVYEQGGVRLRPGDVMLVCSDGIPESLDGAEREFGYERLEVQLRRAQGGSAETILFSVSGSVQDFAAARPLLGDMSLVVVGERTPGRRL